MRAALIAAALLANCSEAPSRTAQAPAAPRRAEAAHPRPTGVPAPAPAATRDESAVLNKRDRVVAGGRRVCAVDFTYAGREAEDLFRDEPCAEVTARMVTRRELEALNRWRRLDPDQQAMVAAMPGGRVLMVEGAVGASVYPVDETGTSIEVAVAD